MAVTYRFTNREAPVSDYNIDANKVNINFDEIAAGTAIDNLAIKNKHYAPSSITLDKLAASTVEALRFGIEGSVATYAALSALDPASEGRGTSYIVEIDESRSYERNNLYQSNGSSWVYVVTLGASGGGDGKIIMDGSDTTFDYLGNKIDTTGLGIDGSYHLKLNDNITGNRSFTGDITINGDLVVSGVTTTIESADLAIADNEIIINSGEAGAGVTLGRAGLRVDRGSLTDYLILFDETDDNFQIGADGNLQAAATREDTPTASGVPYWNSSELRFDTDSNLIWDGSHLYVNSAEVSVSGHTHAAGDVSGIVLSHNGLTGIQGGTTDEYYHLTSGELAGLTDGIDTSLHLHDNRYYTESESDANFEVSGTMNSHESTYDHDTLTNGNDATTLHIHDSRYYTETEANALFEASGSVLSHETTYNHDNFSVSGHSHIESDITDLDKYTQAEADALFVNVAGDIMTGDLTVSGDIRVSGTIYQNELQVSVSGHTHLQDDIVGLSMVHNDLSGLQGGTTDEYYHLTSGEVSGLTTGIDTSLHIHDGRYYTETEIDGFLDADRVPDYIVENLTELNDALTDIKDNYSSRGGYIYVKRSTDASGYINYSGGSPVKVVLPAVQNLVIKSDRQARFKKPDNDPIFELESYSTTLYNWKIEGLYMDGNGTDYSMVSVDTGNDEVVISGDLTTEFSIGSKVLITGSTGNDGVGTIVDINYASPNTTIEVSWDIASATADGKFKSANALIDLWTNQSSGSVSNSVIQDCTFEDCAYVVYNNFFYFMFRRNICNAITNSILYIDTAYQDLYVLDNQGAYQSSFGSGSQLGSMMEYTGGDANGILYVKRNYMRFNNAPTYIFDMAMNTSNCYPQIYEGNMFRWATPPTYVIYYGSGATTKLKGELQSNEMHDDSGSGDRPPMSLLCNKASTDGWRWEHNNATQGHSEDSTADAADINSHYDIGWERDSGTTTIEPIFAGDDLDMGAGDIRTTTNLSFGDVIDFDYTAGSPDVLDIDGFGSQLNIINWQQIVMGDTSAGNVYLPSDTYLYLRYGSTNMMMIPSSVDIVVYKDFELQNDVQLTFGNSFEYTMKYNSSNGNLEIDGDKIVFDLTDQMVVSGDLYVAGTIYENEIPVSVSGHTHVTSDITDLSYEASGSVAAHEAAYDHDSFITNTLVDDFTVSGDILVSGDVKIDGESVATQAYADANKYDLSPTTLDNGPVRISDHFIGVLVGGTLYGEMTWREDNLGTGSGLSMTSEADYPGICRFYTGTTTTGFNSIRQQNTALRPGNSDMRMYIRGKIDAADATDNFIVRMGFRDSHSTEGTNGAYFRYDYSEDTTNWRCVTRDSGVETSTDSGVAIDTNWHLFEIEFNKAGTQVQFKIDESVVATNITNVTGNRTGISFGIYKLAGTNNRTLQLDWMLLEIENIG